MNEYTGRRKWIRSFWQRLQRIRQWPQRTWQWLRRTWQWPQRAWRWLRRAWWYCSERWPLSSVVAFVKALPLLALWLFMAFVVFYRLLSPLIRGPEPEKATATLLTALITALIGFGVQQWKSQADEEHEKRQKREDALREIDELPSLVSDNPSEGARRYVELAARGGVVWRRGRVQAALEDAWNTTAPTQLRDAVDLLGHLADSKRFISTAEPIDSESSVVTLEWAREHLDDYWQHKAWDGLLLLIRQCSEYRGIISSGVLQAIEQRRWHAVLRVWLHLSLWRGFPPATDSEVASSLRCLGLESSPFGSGQAETDTLLLTCRVDSPWFEELRKPQPALLTGVGGSGKTATALLLAYDGLHNQDAFPVYYPVTSGSFELDEIARTLAQTLLHYLAVSPAGFLKRGVTGKSAIAHLLARYACPNLALRFHQAGLPCIGDGAKVFREIETLIQGSLFQGPLSDGELLALLSEARPYGFRYTMILLDVQEQIGSDEGTASDSSLRPLLDLSEALARIGVFVKTFLPDTFQEVLGQHSDQLLVELISLQWSEKDLFSLLDKRLETVKTANNERFEQVGLASAEAKVVFREHMKAAQGTPGGLIRKGNELLRRIGRTQRRLTAQDLDDILGPLPAQSDEAES